MNRTLWKVLLLLGLLVMLGCAVASASAEGGLLIDDERDITFRWTCLEPPVNSGVYYFSHTAEAMGYGTSENEVFIPYLSEVSIGNDLSYTARVYGSETEYLKGKLTYNASLGGSDSPMGTGIYELEDGQYWLQFKIEKQGDKIMMSDLIVGSHAMGLMYPRNYSYDDFMGVYSPHEPYFGIYNTLWCYTISGKPTSSNTASYNANSNITSGKCEILLPEREVKARLSATSGGEALDHVYLIDNYFRHSLPSTSKTFYLTLTAKDVSRKAAMLRVTLPNGLAFNTVSGETGATINYIKTFTVGGKGKSEDSISIPVYAYASQCDDVQIQIEVDGYLSITRDDYTTEIYQGGSCTVKASVIRPSVSLSFSDNPLCYDDGYFRVSPNSTGNKFTLTIKAHNVVDGALSEKITLPNGLSFSNDSVETSKGNISLGKNDVKTFTVYSYKHVRSAFDAIISASGTLSEKLSLNIVPAPTVTMKLLSSATAEEFDTLYYTMGSYSWHDSQSKRDSVSELKNSSIRRMDYSNFDMELTVKNTGGYTGDFWVELPDGFSFKDDEIKIKSEKIPLNGNSSQRVSLIVYPLYSTKTKTDFTVSFTGAIKGDASVPIAVNANEGLIQMRPTTSVNKDDVNALETTISLTPHADFTGSPYSYKKPLAMLGCTLSQAVYNKNRSENKNIDYIYNSLYNLGFSNFAWYYSKNDHDVAVAIADKVIIVNNEVSHVLMVVVRGTVDTEWVGNFKVGESEGSLHTDFCDCAIKVEDCIENYCASGYPKSNARIYLCGHSRAAAVVDLAAHDLNKEGEFKELRAYTFATPNCVKSSQKESGNDNNIFNYCYKWDLVGAVPGGGYEKYGVTYYVGNSTPNNAPDEVKTAFKKLTRGHEYTTTPVGSFTVLKSLNLLYMIYQGDMNKRLTFFSWPVGKIMGLSPVTNSFMARAHGAENYCAWVDKSGTATNDSSFPQKLMEVAAEEYSNMQDAERRMRDKDYPDSMINKWAGRRVIRNTASDFFGNSLKEDVQNKVVDLKTWLNILTNDVKNLDYGVCIHCPVDVTVKDKNGKTLASYKNHVEKSVDSDFLAATDGSSDFFMISGDTDFTFTVTGNDTGEMTVDCVYISPYFQILQESAVKSVPVKKGDTFTLAFDPDNGYTLNLVSGSGQVFDPSWQPTGATASIDQVEKLLRMLNNLLPGHIDAKYASSICDGLAQCMRLYPDALFMSLPSSMGVSLCRAENGQIVKEVARSYNISATNDINVNKKAFASDAIFTMTCDKTLVYILPYDTRFIPYIVGRKASSVFDMGLGLFDKTGALLDVAAITGTPLKSGKSLALWNNGAAPGTLSALCLYDRQSTQYLTDRYNTEPNIVLPAGLKEIEEEAFFGDEFITGFVVIPEGVTSIGARAFTGTNISFLSLPRTLKKIDNNAFAGMLPKPTLLVFSGSYAEKWADAHGFDKMIYSE